MSYHTIPTGVDIEHLSILAATIRPYFWIVGNVIEFTPDIIGQDLVLLNDMFVVCQAKSNYQTVPTWVKTGTASEAETYINGLVLSGQTKAQLDTWIDTNITNITTANVSQINARLLDIRNGMKLIGGALVAIRDLFIVVSKLLIYIRDYVIRYR